MKFSALNFSCPNCGAPQKFSPATNTMVCEFCGTTTPIERLDIPIDEYDFHAAMETLNHQKIPYETNKEVACQKCGATFLLQEQTLATSCPYCGTPTITEFIRDITPKSLVPFRITKEQAQQQFQQWAKKRWLAPRKFHLHLENNKNLQGYYLPYWTYDSYTTTHYQGMRGDVYYVTVTRSVMINGRPTQQTVREPRIRWTPKSGTVQVGFDDITIGATKNFSRIILDAIEPWDTTTLVPFKEKYLSGFEAEEYTIALDNGFEYAKMKIDTIVRQHIRRDIGGDQQQINHLQTIYNNTTYKSILLPLWATSFEWKNQEYHYAINGQTGKISGEYPYSYGKIALIIITIIIAIALFGYVAEFDTLNGVTFTH